jgi:hypothetical protein
VPEQIFPRFALTLDDARDLKDRLSAIVAALDEP